MKNLLLTLTALVCLTSCGHTIAAPDLKPSCTVQASVVMGPNELGQYLLNISIPEPCQEETRLARIITRNGGRLPPLGYFKLGKNAPDFIRYWVFKGAKVQDREAPNVWVTVPIKGARWSQ